MEDRLAEFRQYDLARCFTCNGEFPDEKAGNQRYCSEECVKEGEKLYHALYDSLPEQLKRRRQYMEAVKNAQAQH